MKIISTNSTGTISSFYFVSDNYTALALNETIHDACGSYNFNISSPIPFNSTGNIHFGSVVQYYRGDSAAMVLEGYDNTKKLPHKHNLKRNPPLPPDVLDTWTCFHKAIGDSIPLMHGKVYSPGMIAMFVLVSIFGAFMLFYVCGKCGEEQEEEKTGKMDSYTSLPKGRRSKGKQRNY